MKVGQSNWEFYFSVQPINIQDVLGDLKMKHYMGLPLEVVFIMVDSCAVWPPVSSEREAMEELRRIEDRGEINGLEIAGPTEEELQKAPLNIRNWANGRNITWVPPETIEERQQWQAVRSVLFGTKSTLTPSNKNDVDNIYTVVGCPNIFFVTYDKRHILNKADILWDKFRVRCVAPSECLKIIKTNLASQKA